MKTIGELLARDLGQPIEEIIKLDQTDEASVYTEITEYVVTSRIKEQYLELLRAIASAPSEPHEGIGVWVSGFFGSGKSSFAKNLGYILANRSVLGRKASDLFKVQVGDPRVDELLDFINVRIPTEVVMFDVSVDRAVKKATERIAEIMYTVLLRELDYAEDYDVAELEIELEGEGKLEEFIARCRDTYGEWRTVRKGAQKISRASALLHQMDPATYPSPDSWSVSLGAKAADITVGKLAERAFELCARRRPGKALVFIIDEVGQYVARSADKILDLQAIVREFGPVGKNRVKAGKAIAPVWIVVTSQEKLDEVVAAIDSRRVELAKLQDSFKYRIDLSPSDIREVATRRVLAKKEEAVPALEQLFSAHEGQLNAALQLERTHRPSRLTRDDFVQFYPYPPHFIELSIDIMSGIRLQPGAPKHLGGSNRTIIKQAYEMLVSRRTALAAKPVGALVTLDGVFELVEGNLSTEKQKDISDVAQRFRSDPEDRGMALRVAKVICLLEYVRDLPRTEANIAACLVDEVGSPAPLAAVEAALKKLHDAQFVRNTEEGWKLQTAQEKNWETERRGNLEPKPRDRNQILRDALGEIFADPKLRSYRFKDLRTFSVGIAVDGSRVGDEGNVLLSVCTAEDTASFPSKLEEVRSESRLEAHKNDLYWVLALTPEIDDLVANVHASNQMVAKYEQVRAENRITNDEAACLAAEKNELARYRSRLRERVIAAFEDGQGVFRGVSRDAPSLGKSIGEICRKLLDFAIPELYPKLAMGSRPLKGNEAEEILKAANLSGLPQVFYGGPQGLNLVVKEGQNYVANPAAEVAKEVLDYLVQEQALGSKETRIGKALETHFGGLGYGWDRDMLRLILATLFRAGAIEVTYNGQRFDSYTDPHSREPFTNNTAFRSALFTPAKQIDLKTLTRAVQSYEDLTGQTVEVDKNAISSAVKKLAEEEAQYLATLEALARTHSLPVLSELEEYRATLDGIKKGSADDAVGTLAGEGKSLKEARDRVRRLRAVVGSKKGLAQIARARVAVEEMWPVLKARGADGALAADASELAALLASESFYDSMSQIQARSDAIVAAYRSTYSEWHAKRAQAFQTALESIKGLPEWVQVSADAREPVLAPLVSRACQELEIPEGKAVCGNCAGTISQMESDFAGLAGLKAGVVLRIQQLTRPPDGPDQRARTQRVRLSDFFDPSLDSEDAVERGVEQLREHLIKLIHEGVMVVVE